MTTPYQHNDLGCSWIDMLYVVTLIQSFPFIFLWFIYQKVSKLRTMK